MSWLKIGNIKGAKGDNGASGSQGISGANGSNGSNGVSPVLAIGTVTSGSPAAATITGSQANPVLNLTIPPGAQGPAGVSPTVPAMYAKLHTTASDGTLTVTWPSGRFSAAPVVNAMVIASDPTFVYQASLLTCTATSATFKVYKFATVAQTIVLGGTVAFAQVITASANVMVRATSATD